ncbi:MAG: hypothetical protein ABI640_14820 [Gammaproteobacteria bacterium]
MNRNHGYLLFFAAGLFIAGCSGHSGSANPPGPGATPSEVDLAAFARTAIADPESGDARVVNDVTFKTSEQETELNDWF